MQNPQIATIILNCQKMQLLWLPFRFPAYEIPSERGSTEKGKNMLPRLADSFLLE